MVESGRKRVIELVNKFEEMLEQLAVGEINEISIQNSEFFIFREAWAKRADRVLFVGEAAHGGHVIYRYEKPQVVNNEDA
ncbi:hypothetical protein I6N96_04180 [Enterococcus sp. BWM-S5]|uniref:Uncharacterized protein n=1 Tax=Enterococcus larvae TaxID=2794352 RepID=A0ABS4CGR0_9ENTE|nr:hypothetical protein [Enterococcus larvae]